MSISPRFSPSTRKFLRRQKARLRKETFDAEEAEKKIKELVKELTAQYAKERSKDSARA